ncbi:polysaccharide biosynthesis/export family protein [Alisedimentitalea sp. MJ-SS2]|uniref:polysaccharide biosynthesis/export family protein n=1 Tax=Aliisedimentitalea sp. MJ-SS2 TaxID=3049795 RepID=UPI00290CBB57|nr:polysaccharide biosynthesis/export family protein [Alisedimentitalea sp. MJ-SS2]MDU8929432.1 polysaccharide biosynthesis/export family protein [Alisedimentitalea sp. MJ-SS2]
MQVVTKRFLLLAAMVFLAGCTLPRGAGMVKEILKEQDKDAPSFQVVEVTRANVAALRKWPATGWAGGYRWLSGSRGPAGTLIRPGDVVDLVIWDSQENSLLTPNGDKVVEMRGLVVSPTGDIFVPYVQDMRINGLSPQAAREKIQEALLPVSPDAQVQLSHRSGQSNSADLVSGVAKPGAYPLEGRNITILSLIARGGGISNKLRNPLVRLIRSGKTYEVRADDLFANASKNVVIRGNDKVLVEEDQRYFTALGATGREELVHFEKEQLTALEVLSIIGGLSDSRANPKGVLVLRDYTAKQVRRDGKGPEMQQVVFTFDLTTADGLFAARKFEINPRDTVLATESPVTAVRTIMSLLGTAIGLGTTINDNI